MQASSLPPFNPFLFRPAVTSAGAQPVPDGGQSPSRTFPTVSSAEETTGTRPGTDNRPSAGESGGQRRAGEAEEGAPSGSRGQAAEPQAAQGRESSQGRRSEENQDPRQRTAPRGPDGEPLTPEEVALLDDLQARDREVRQHELAHQAVGGQFAGAASFTFRQGPDGRAYAVGGEVPIDVSPVPGDPRATIAKMRIVRAAALAPAEPSAADRQIAAQATAQMIAAQAELARSSGENSPQEPAAEESGSEETAPAGITALGGVEAAQTYASVSLNAQTSRPIFSAVA